MKKKLQKIFEETLKECSPDVLIAREVTLSEDKKLLRIQACKWKIEDKPVYIIGVGKAAPQMVATLEDLLAVDSENIICIAPQTAGKKQKYCIHSSHPVPDKKSVYAAEKLIGFIENIPPGAIVLFAISGGASSLVCKPARGLSLKDVNTTHKLLLNSGATIQQINRVRKHLSAIKGGQLLHYFKQSCTLIDLFISDVPDDNLEVIGSGLTVTDSSTFRDARKVLDKYELWEGIPATAKQHIQKGINGEISETLKPGNDPIEDHDSFIIGSSRLFAQKAAVIAQQKGYQTWVAKEAFNIPAVEVAKDVFEQIKKWRAAAKNPIALFFYGESTVKVTGTGKGGRNQELALYGAILIADMPGVAWLSAGTDGVDGPTDAAGAIVDGQTISGAEKKGLNARNFLENNDSYHFHEQMGTLLKTGATGNNMMDIVIVLIG